MSTVSDVFGSSPPKVTVPSVPEAGRGTLARGRATIPDTEREGNRLVAKVWAVAETVGTDLLEAWPWHGSAPTLRDLWQTRHPDIIRVPGQNRALWALWVAGNYAALAPTAYLSTLLWSLQHPCRYPIAAVLIAIPAVIWQRI